VIVPDVNLLLHAHNRNSRSHKEARDWWTRLLNGDETVGLAWVTLLGFVRILTHPRALAEPLRPEIACSVVREWLELPNVSILHPGERHGAILFGLLEALGTAGDLTTDAHLAALAIEYQAELHSSDADFARFPGLRWTNPLK
jgi:hypothetical protein